MKLCAQESPHWRETQTAELIAIYQVWLNWIHILGVYRLECSMVRDVMRSMQDGFLGGIGVLDKIARAQT